MASLAEIGKHLGVSRTRAHELKGQGMPTNTLRAAKLWRDKQPQRRAATNKKTAKLQPKKKGRPKAPKKLSKTGDSLTDILRNAIALEEVAFQSYQDAALIAGNGQSILLSNHTKAAEAVARLEKLVREEKERQKILVPRMEIVEACRRGMDAMLRRLRKLPNEIGPQCSGLDSIKSVAILQRAVDEVLSSGQKAMNEL